MQDRMLFVVLVTALLATAAPGRSGPPGDTDVIKGDLGQRVDRYLSRVVPFGYSGSMLVARDGEVVLNKGYGLAVRSRGIANTSQTVHNLGSLTKQFTAAAIMTLEMQGKLSTDDPISKHLPSVPPDKSAVTLHQLLTHTGGIVNGVGEDYVVARRDATVKKILDAPLESRPGTEFSYSNAGYALLAAIIEHVTGKKYEQYLHDHLFKPAGMEFTGYRIPDWSKRVVAHWYAGDEDNGVPLTKPYPEWNVVGNGEIMSTTDDMYKWHLALLGDEILSPAAKKKMWAPALNDYAYGWDVIEGEHGTLIQHDGGTTLGSSALFRRYIDARTVTMLFCNQDYSGTTGFGPIAEPIETLVFGGTVPEPPALTPSPSVSLEKYAGEYQIGNEAGFKASVENRRLLLEPFGQAAIDALFSEKPPNPNRYAELKARAAAIVEAATRGDFEPLEQALARKEQLEAFKAGLKRFVARAGTNSKVDVVGSLPASNGFATVVRMVGKDEAVSGTLVWDPDGRLARISGLAGVPAFPFVPESATDFVGYELRRALTARARFGPGEMGVPTSLTIVRPDREVVARRKAS